MSLSSARSGPPKGLALAIALGIIYSSFAVDYNRARALMDARFADADRVAPTLLHYTRETLLVLLVVVLIHWVFQHRLVLNGRIGVSPWVLMFTLFVIWLALRTILLGYPVAFLAYGLRPAILLLVLTALRHFPVDEAQSLLLNIARWCKPVLLAELVLALYQVRTSPTYFGETAFGARPWGTLSAPNNLAAACLGFALIFVVAKPQRWLLWFGLSSLVVLVSGSRTSLIGVATIVAILAVGRMRGAPMLIPAGVGFGGILLYVVSHQAISGRTIQGEGRFTNWAIILAELNPVDWITGKAMGVGTNAAYLADPAMFSVPVTDSQIIAQLLSFGMVGVLFMLIGAIHLWDVSGPGVRPLIFAVLGLTALVFNVAEYYPVNLILALVLGLTARRCSCVERLPGPGGSEGTLRRTDAGDSAIARPGWVRAAP